MTNDLRFVKRGERFILQVRYWLGQDNMMGPWSDVRVEEEKYPGFKTIVDGKIVDYTGDRDDQSRT